MRPEINGLLELLPVDVGDRVKKDALLFRLDDKLLQQQRASNLTDIEKAKLNLEKAERDHKRAQQLLADKLISQEVYDDTKTALRPGQERPGAHAEGPDPDRRAAHQDRGAGAV